MRAYDPTPPLFYGVTALFLALAVTGLAMADSLYGRGAAALFAGVVLTCVGVYRTAGRPAGLRGALARARAKGRFWWLPLAGLGVAVSGSITIGASPDATSLEQTLALGLVIATAAWAIERLAHMPKTA